MQSKKTNQQYINSCFNYTGNKYKQLNQLFRYFPKNVDVFVDLFCGGSVVGLNALKQLNTHKVIINDNSKQLMNTFRYFKKHSYVDIKRQIDSIIDYYNLSRTSKFGYKFYGVDSSKGLAAVNKNSFMKLRADYNANTYNSRYAKAVIFYVLIVFAFNNQIRFNRKNEYNLPVGKRDFNLKMQHKLCDFVEALHDQKIELKSTDYSNIDIPVNSFVYCDPPYSITTATYSEGNSWSFNDDKKLFDFLDKLDKKHIMFALSNVLYHNGRENTALLQWSRKYKIHQIEFNYNNSNYHSQAKQYRTKEVLITNIQN